MNNIELYIQNGGTLYAPVCAGDVTWETERKGSPGRLEFTVLKGGGLDFQEGNNVRLKVGEKDVFYGYVFSKKRSGSKPEEIQVTAYDQLRYFKNKDTYVYENKTAGQLIAMIAEDFRLKTGELEDTGCRIPARAEDNKTLFDIVQNALDFTLQNSGKMYVLYSDFDRLTLKNIDSMRLPVLICGGTVQDFDYSTSIDSNTYNKIKLSYENKDTKKREIYIAQDSEHMNSWGVLQMYEKLNNSVNGKARAQALLSLYDKKSRSLSIKKALGDIRVRGGSGVPVSLDLGDMIAQTYMIVEKVKHTISGEKHFMDLTLRGSDFNS